MSWLGNMATKVFDKGWDKNAFHTDAEIAKHNEKMSKASFWAGAIKIGLILGATALAIASFGTATPLAVAMVGAATSAATLVGDQVTKQVGDRVADEKEDGESRKRANTSMTKSLIDGINSQRSCLS